MSSLTGGQRGVDSSQVIYTPASVSKQCNVVPTEA